MNAAVSPVPLRRILVVDDDPGLRTLVSGFLRRNGCAADTAADTREMRARLADGRYDLVVLDLLMPGEDGLAALRRLQAEDGDAPPVIMLSAAGADIDRIIGLEVGAADYLAKPCNPRELLARISTVLRRRRPGGQQVREATGTGLCFASWRVDLAGRTLRNGDGTPVRLTEGEFSLLRAFVEHPRRVLSRDRLLGLARGGGGTDPFDRAIDVQVSRLRRRLGSPDLIRTVRSEGYMFAVQPTGG